jgi:hypothetical protein
MSAEGVGRWRSAWRALGRVGRRITRGFRAIWNAFEFIDFLVLVVRVVTWPFRVLARALDALW